MGKHGKLGIAGDFWKIRECLVLERQPLNCSWQYAARLLGRTKTSPLSFPVAWDTEWKRLLYAFQVQVLWEEGEENVQMMY